jgi:hypothetical protein
MHHVALLADFVFWDVVHAWMGAGDARLEVFIVFGAIFIVSLVAFIVVVLVTQRRRRRHRHSTSSRSESRSSRPSRRRFRRRREDDPLNPTLAQTDGLPPARRDEDNPPPA